MAANNISYPINSLSTRIEKGYTSKFILLFFFVQYISLPWDMKADYNKSAMFKNIYYNFNWLVVLRIYVALAMFQQYHDLEAGDFRNRCGKTGNRSPDEKPSLR